MRDPTHYPRLRWPIDIRTETLDQQELIILSCPLGVAEQPLVLVAQVAPILSCFEGKLSIDEIHARFAPHGLERQVVVELVTILDRHLFLDSPRFYEVDRSVRQRFHESTVRPAALAGLSYPLGADELSRHIDSFLSLQGEAVADAPLQHHPDNLLALVAPHIDYMRGGVAYGRTYEHLRGRTTVDDLYIIIGTSHQFSRRLFHLTTKDFITPLGALPNDRTFVSELSMRYGADRSFADEFLHRREHSLELQLPFLQRVVGNVPIVPILVGGFHRMVAAGRLPNEFDEYESFAAALTELVGQARRAGRNPCLIAGVDMAHIGRAFGDEGSLSTDRMLEIERRDREYLSTIARSDKKALFLHIAEDQDARRICGYPTMYLVLDVLERLAIDRHFELFEYRQAVNYSSDCAVTFAGGGVYKGRPRLAP